MVRSYELQGLEPEFNNIDKKYPAVNLLVQPGFISATRRATGYGFIMTLEDLVNVASDTKENEFDVVSDMVGIAEDITALLRNPIYGDWTFSGDNTFNFLFEHENNITAGVQLIFSITTDFTSNTCQVPSNDITTIINANDIKVYWLEYTAGGTEGSTLTIPTINGKYIISVVRETSPIHQVSNSPDPAEYTWNNTLIILGAPVNVGERFLILYRNY